MKLFLHFPKGTTLESELRRVMNLLASEGVRYPAGYGDTLIGRYREKGIQYPRILMRMGDPNIRKHRRYREILKKEGDLLDFGCGTGDDIRALIKDGFPRGSITGYDVNGDSIDLGFDLYLDRNTLGIKFAVSPQLQYDPSAYDSIYSGSVLHILVFRRAIVGYAATAFDALKPGGTFFGSTLGFGEKDPGSQRMQSPGWLRTLFLNRVSRKLVRRITVLTTKKLRGLLISIGFTDIEVYQDDTFTRLEFYAKKSSLTR